MKKQYILSLILGISFAFLLSPSYTTLAYIEAIEDEIDEEVAIEDEIVIENEIDEEIEEDDTFNERLSISYLYHGTTNSMINAVDDIDGEIDIVLPEFFEVTSSGNLRIAYFEEEFIEAMRERDIKIVPYITNHWVRSVGHSGMDNRDELSTQIAEAIIKYDFDGIDIDIENLSHEYKDAQTDFIKQLREKLPDDKILSLAIAANPNDVETGWHGSYDYKELEKYLDYFFLMTYDERTVGSAAGPTASYDFVENSIIQLVDIHDISPSKIVLGVPFYGRYWKYDGSETGGHALTNTVIESMRESRGRTKRWSEEYNTPYTILYLSEGAKLGGRNLTAGDYIFWYEDLDSLIHKVRLVHKYDLKGYGSWNLNMANKEQVKVLRKWNNGDKYFYDMIDHPHEKEAAYSLNAGWFDNNVDERFIPNQVLNKGNVAITFNSIEEINPLYVLYPELSIVNNNPLLSSLLNANTSVLKNLEIYNQRITQDEVVNILKSYNYDIDTSGLDNYEVLTKSEMAYLMYQVDIQNNENKEELEKVVGTVE